MPTFLPDGLFTEENCGRHPDALLSDMLDIARERSVFSGDEVVDMLLDLVQSIGKWMNVPIDETGLWVPPVAAQPGA